MTFNFNAGIPAPNDNPSIDQPDMLTNNVSMNAILAVDHVSFNTANGGQHKQVTINNKTAPGAQTDPQSVVFTVSGTASTVAELRFKNQNGTFPISSIKAFADFTGAGSGVIAANKSFNVSSISANTVGTVVTFTCTLTANATTGNNAVVLIYPGSGGTFSQGQTMTNNYSFIGGVLTITYQSSAAPHPILGKLVNFVVIQI